MKKPFLIPFVLGAALVMCIGALIHEYPANTTPALSDMTLLDTGTAYNSATLGNIRTVMFASPTFTGTTTVSGSAIVNGTTTVNGPLAVSGTISTNELGGVNVITNINGTTIPTPFVFGGVSAADATNAAITVVAAATNGLPMGVTGSGSAVATTNGSGVVNIAVTAGAGDVTTAQLASATNITLTTATDRITSATNTIQGFRYGTNQGSLAIGNNIAVGEWFGFATNDNFTIAGLSGVSTAGTNVQKFTMIITNTAGPTTKTMTLPAHWIRADGVSCFITNQGILTGVVYPGLGTNAAFKCLK